MSDLTERFGCFQRPPGYWLPIMIGLSTATLTAAARACEAMHDGMAHAAFLWVLAIALFVMTVLINAFSHKLVHERIMQMLHEARAMVSFGA